MIDAKLLTPLNGMVVVVDDEKEERKGSIYLPETSEGDRMIAGTVLAGSYFMLQDGTYVKPEVKANDRIFYSQHAGAGCTWIEDKRTYRVIRHNEMLAKIRNK
jgi:co-chaperonin GroES (HSP10)